MIKITKFILLLTTITLFSCSTSRVYQPKRINVEGDYFHNKTKISFPLHFDDFNRTSITSFNLDSTDIGVSYNIDNTKQNALATIYIYPAPISFENRLRNEYFACLQSIADVSNRDINVVQKPMKISKDGYKLLGLRASVRDIDNKTVLLLFECGKYFIKYRISSKDTDTNELFQISNILIDRFSPFDIVKQLPLKITTSIHVAPNIIRDSVSLNPILEAAMTKFNWVDKNVDSLERCSGYPSLYFEEQNTSITNMLNKWVNSKDKNGQLKKYFDDLLIIRNSGFLNEFIFDQYGGILLLPDGLKLDIDNYAKWKKINKPTVKLLGQTYYYLIGYEDSYNIEK